jgi:hypothetical protein
MKGKQMTLAKKGIARKVKLAILGTLLIVIASTAFAIAASTTGLLGGTIDNSGELSPAGAVGSPLVVIRHNSMWNGSVPEMGGHNDPSQFVIIDKIEWTTLYGAGANTNSFITLNKTAISIYNNGSETLYPAWTVIGLPTGYTLNCYVAVTVQGSQYSQLAWSSGYLWAQNDYNAFVLRSKDFNQADYYRMVFVLTASATAIPGTMNFQIQFAYSTTPT